MGCRASRPRKGGASNPAVRLNSNISVEAKTTQESSKSAPLKEVVTESKETSQKVVTKSKDDSIPGNEETSQKVVPKPEVNSKEKCDLPPKQHRPHREKRPKFRQKNEGDAQIPEASAPAPNISAEAKTAQNLSKIEPEPSKEATLYENEEIASQKVKPKPKVKCLPENEETSQKPKPRVKNKENNIILPHKHHRSHQHHRRKRPRFRPDEEDDTLYEVGNVMPSVDYMDEYYEYRKKAALTLSN